MTFMSSVANSLFTAYYGMPEITQGPFRK